MEAILSQFLNQFLINFNQFSHSDSQKHTKTRCRLTKTYKSPLCLTQTHKNVQNSSFFSHLLSKTYKISLCLTQTHKNIQNFTLSHTDSQKHTKFHFVSLRVTKTYKIPLCLTLRLSKTYKVLLCLTKFHFVSKCF